MKKIVTLTLLAIGSTLASFAQIKGLSPASTCTGIKTYVYDTIGTGGGVWTSSNTSILTVSALPPHGANITGVSAGIAVITYTVGSTSDMLTVTVNPSPASITGITHMCISSSVTFSCATTGGIWTSTSPGVVAIGSTSGYATGMSGGTTWIKYTIGSCSTSIQDTVQTTYIDTIIKGPSSVCVSSTITLSDATSGGTWTSSNPAVATVGTSGIVTGVSSGTASISYSVSGMCGMAYAYKVITVGSTTIPGTISGSSSIMATTSTTLTETVSGGSWSSSNPSVATITSSGYVSGISAGTTIISYTVTGCGGTAYATFPLTVTAFDGISGDVLFTGSAYYGSVKVWLIKYNPSTFDLQAYDSTTLYCSSGTSVHYQFIGVPTDSFRVKAFGDSSTFASYVPTYHTSSFYWYSANVIPHVSGTGDINKDITMIPGVPAPGPGFIGGSVFAGANKGTSGSTPVVGLQMYLIDAAGTLVAKTKTDGSGAYSFSGLAYNTYQVFPEALNYKTTAFTGITLSSTNASVTNAAFTKHTVSHTITPGALNIGTVENKAQINMFPNPSNGTVNIMLNAQVKVADIKVKDLSGRELVNTNIAINNGAGTLDLSSLPNGQYLLNIRSGNLNVDTKVQIIH